MANNLMRFDPFREMSRLDPFRDMDDMFRDLAMTPGMRGGEGGARIRMDVDETDQNYQITADIPGVNKEDIKVAIDGNQVSISAQVKEEKETTSKGVLRSERYYGQQYRSITLPQEVDDTKAEARYEGGVLRLTLPKKPGTGGKQLTIQ